MFRSRSGQLVVDEPDDGRDPIDRRRPSVSRGSSSVLEDLQYASHVTFHTTTLLATGQPLQQTFEVNMKHEDVPSRRDGRLSFEALRVGFMHDHVFSCILHLWRQ